WRGPGATLGRETPCGAGRSRRAPRAHSASIAVGSPTPLATKTEEPGRARSASSLRLSSRGMRRRSQRIELRKALSDGRARGDPHVVMRGDVLHEARQRADPADDAQVKPERHDLRLRGALRVELREAGDRVVEPLLRRIAG